MKPSRVQIDPAPQAGPPPEVTGVQPYARSAARLSTIGLFALASLFALHEASTLVAPMAAALVVGVVLSRIGDRAQALGVPPFLAATAFVLATGAGIVLAASALTSRISSLIERAPEIASRFSGALESWTRPLQALKTQIFGATAQPGLPALAGRERGDRRPRRAYAGARRRAHLSRHPVLLHRGTRRPATKSSWPARTGSAAVGAAHPQRRRGSAGALFGRRRAGLRRAGGSHRASRVGDGSRRPFLWGVFVFVACFVPFLGVAIVFAALLAAGLTVRDGLLAGMAPAVASLIAHLALENAALPAIVGKRFEINPFLVFVSIVFWTWMWGAIGAVIASPSGGRSPPAECRGSASAAGVWGRRPHLDPPPYPCPPNASTSCVSLAAVSPLYSPLQDPSQSDLDHFQHTPGSASDVVWAVARASWEGRWEIFLETV